MFRCFKTWLMEEFVFLKGNYLIIILSYVLSGFSSGLWSPFRSNYIEALGASLLEIGLISSVSSALSAFVTLPGAYITDRYGRKRIIIVFTYFVAVGYLVHALAPDWWFILIGTVILNLSRVYLPALRAIEADSIPKEKRGMGYSLFNLAAGIFAAISPPIAGLIVARYELIPGIRILYLAGAGFILAIAILRTLYLEETIEVTPVEYTGFLNPVRDALRSFKEAVGEMNRDIWGFAAVQLLYSFESPIYSVYISLYMIDIAGITEVQWGVVNSVFLPVSILLGIPAGKLVDNAQRRHSILLGYTLTAVVGLILAYTGGFGWVLVAFIFRAVGQTIVFPSVHALMADLIPVDKRGRIIGLISFLQNLIAVPAALVFALIFEVSSRALFLSSVVIEVASILIFITLFKQNDLRIDG
jgi:MFS family permease